MISEELRKAREYEEQYGPSIGSRPAFHLTPLIGWMNDPNGFSYYKGKYHMFYQYHPYSIEWGPMHWGHAVSDDMLHWEYLPCALAPDQPYDREGCFSGSALELPDGRQLLMYTGVHGEIQEDGSKKDYQTQCLAVGDGIDYEKIEANPVLTALDLPEGGSPEDFRDPKIWRDEDGTYACIVGNRPSDGSGSVLLYRSTDGLRWIFDGIVDQSRNELGKMWECPDFFYLDGRWVILVSPQDMSPIGLEFHNGNGTMCIIGRYDKETRTFQRESVQAIDYGIDYYATQTTLTPDGRRVVAAWMQNWDACASFGRDQRWFGQLALPRELHIQNGRLIQQPIHEIESMWGRRIFHKITLVNEESSIPGVCGRYIDMTVSVTPNADEIYHQFCVKTAHGGQYYTMVIYKPYRSTVCIDRSHSGFCRDMVHERRCLVRDGKGKIRLRIILDRYSMEVFINDGEQAMTATIFTPMSADGICFEVQGQAMVEVVKYDLIT